LPRVRNLWLKVHFALCVLKVRGRENQIDLAYRLRQDFVQILRLFTALVKNLGSPLYGCVNDGWSEVVVGSDVATAVFVEFLGD
jgi:hypothetical protein